MDLVLLVVRIAVGLLFIGHGTQKLFGWFGGHGLEATAGFMAVLGYNPPRRAAQAAGLSETAGGILLAVGFLTPLAAAIIVGTMVNAIASVHWDKGVWSTDGGYEFPLVMALMAVLITATGPGLASLDAAFGWTLWGGIWAVLASLIGVLIGAVVHSTRRPGRADADAAAHEASESRRAA